ncbi:ammonium transporter [Thermogymnomonas acidicola]|uniref:Ammonium transporter n=2 Tax=Thermogymnomonas acidicola TaxID=399579 RepID=A0AA37BT49_9ARCH|nr:ammonium transporter [Thermogymnomonas acidicola]GGM78865.1 ammonium transporter [Thermogymnomonas acidicola]
MQGKWLGITAAACAAIIAALFYLSMLFGPKATSGNLVTGSSWLNTGNNSWMMIAGTLVGLQSIPGVALYYAGLTRRKHAVNTSLMVFYAFACVLIVWVAVAYRMAFGPGSLLTVHGYSVLGTPAPSLSGYFLGMQSAYGPGGSLLSIPNATFIFFQFVFAAITPVLIVGGVIERMNFRAWMLYVPMFTVLVYAPLAYWLFAGGWLAQMGAVDFSGGYVIHLDAGVSALAAAMMVGPRVRKGSGHEAHNMMLVLAGTGLIWLGWNGFNGGDPGGATIDASIAVLNTNLAAAVSTVTWMAMDQLLRGKPSLIGATTGAITGLVAITPAAGYVNGLGAIAIGIAAGTVPWFFLNRVEPKMGIDDSLGVFSSHAISGLVGGILTGVFADPAVTAYIEPGLRGALYGNPSLLLVQVFSGVFVMGYVLLANLGILKLISLFVPLRADEASVHHGDIAAHGEVAYAEEVHIERLEDT